LMVYLESRGYYNLPTNPESQQISSWSDVEDEREKQEHISEDKAVR